MSQNLHDYGICCRLEAAGDVISGENLKTVDGYAVLNVEVASFSNFRDIPKKSFRDGGGADGHRR